MGCFGSKAVPESKTFSVTILDAQEREIGRGDLFVNSEYMELQQHGVEGKARWELRYLRRFGYDKRFFSFEAGRRCTDGPGIWAVSTLKAKQLFQIVDHHINQTKQTPEDEKVPDSGGAVSTSNYAGVKIDGTSSVNGGNGAGPPSPKKNVAYAHLDLSSNSKFKIPSSNGKSHKTKYADLDFDQMEAQAQSDNQAARL